MNTIVTLILFLLIFSVVVLSHEFGHFIVAKKNGVRVLEFSIGMGPMLFHIDKGDTTYAIRALPFGGACLFEGLDDALAEENRKADGRKEEVQAASEEKEVTEEDLRQENAPGSFLKAGIWTRIAIIFAGPLFNMLLGLLVGMILVGLNGVTLPVVQGLMENSAAQEAGMEAGDLIVKINGERIHLYGEVSLHSALNFKGKSMTVTYARDGQQYETVITPRFSEEDNRYYLGIMGGGENYACKGLEIIKYGFFETEYALKMVLKSLQMLVTGQLGADSLSGPVGIAHVVGDTYKESKTYGGMVVFLNMLNLILIISVNLGVMNLLPLPALDGGRLIFLFVELVRGKPVPPEKEAVVHFAGFIFFFLLMIFVMYNDIMHYFVK